MDSLDDIVDPDEYTPHPATQIPEDPLAAIKHVTDWGYQLAGDLSPSALVILIADIEPYLKDCR